MTEPTNFFGTNIFQLSLNSEIKKHSNVFDDFVMPLTPSNHNHNCSSSFHIRSHNSTFCLSNRQYFAVNCRKKGIIFLLFLADCQAMLLFFFTVMTMIIFFQNRLFYYHFNQYHSTVTSMIIHFINLLIYIILQILKWMDQSLA